MTRGEEFLQTDSKSATFGIKRIMKIGVGVRKREVLE
jgi:hypothetical protein